MGPLTGSAKYTDTEHKKSAAIRVRIRAYQRVVLCSQQKEVTMFKAIISTLVTALVTIVILPTAVFGQDVFGPVPWWVKDGDLAGMKFRGISVVDSQLVWVVGENGAVYKKTGTVHQHTWEQKNNGINTNYNLNDVCFVNAGVGWVVGEKKTEPNKYSGVIYRTINGGTSWTDQTGYITPTITIPTPFLKVQMIYIGSQYKGYITCGNGMVLKTEDGGATWTRTTTPWADPAHPQDSIQIWYNGLWVNPNNAQELWVGGDAYGLMSHSVNGGGSWTASQPTTFNQTYDFPDSTFTPFGTRLATYNMHCANANEGMIALSYGKLGRTVNGGASWNTIQLEPPADSPIWFKDVTYDGAEWLACGNFGIIDRYTGAVTQENVNYRWLRDRAFSDFQCIDVASSNYAYAAGDGSGNVRQRYDPGEVDINVAIQDTGNYYKVNITINGNIENFKNWICSGPWVNEHLWRCKLLCPMPTQDTTYYNYIDKNTTPNRDIFYEIYLRTNDFCSSDFSVQEVALITVHPDSLYGTWANPDSDLDLTTQDTPNDQGLTYRYYITGNPAGNPWSHFVIHNVPWSNDYYRQEQAVNPPWNYYYLYDTTVQTGRTYTSRIFRCKNNEPWGFVEETVPGPITITDDSCPFAPVFDDTACKYDAATYTIKLVWKMDSWANNPDIAGYWVCPIPPDSNRHHYRLAHSAPISRTTCRLPVDTVWIDHYAVYYVAAMDYSGHISPWSESLAIYIGSSIALSNSAEATAFNNGRKLIRIPDTDELWTAYESDNKVYTARSTDAGGSWTKMLIGYGHYPALSYNSDAETPRPAVVYQGQNESSAPTIYCSRYTGDDAWTSPLVIQTGAAGTSFGPPSLAIGIGDTAHVVYVATAVSAVVKYTKFYLFDPMPPTPEDAGTGQHASIGYMNSAGKPPIHVAWANNNVIYYRSRSSSGWAGTENVSGLMSAKQPSLEVIGNNAYIVWAQNTTTGDIYWRCKVYTGPFGVWSGVKRVCSTGSTASTYPVLTGGYTCAWVEQGDPSYEIYYATYDESSGQWNTPVNVSDNPKEENYSNYPNLAHKQTVNNTTLYFVWTEGSEDMETAPPYKIKFKSKELTQEKSLTAKPLPYYIAYGGEEEPSPFNLKRDGYDQYGEDPCKRIDRADVNNFLEYRFETLDPDRIYDLTAYLYQRGSNNLTLSAKIDNILLSTVNLPSDTLITFNHLIPTAIYADNTINLKIIGKNNQAVSAILALHEFESEDVKGHKQIEVNGPQEIGSKPVTSYQLSLTVQPTHSVNSISIRYALPQKGPVKISLYDVSGRRVINLVDKIREAGIYNLDCGTGDLSRGVYFVRLETDNKALVQKTIVVK